jgi:hypothetical protein
LGKVSHGRVNGFAGSDGAHRSSGARCLASLGGVRLRAAMLRGVGQVSVGSWVSRKRRMERRSPAGFCGVRHVVARSCREFVRSVQPGGWSLRGSAGEGRFWRVGAARRLSRSGAGPAGRRMVSNGSARPCSVWSGLGVRAGHTPGANAPRERTARQIAATFGVAHRVSGRPGASSHGRSRAGGAMGEPGTARGWERRGSAQRGCACLGTGSVRHGLVWKFAGNRRANGSRRERRVRGCLARCR